MKLLRIAFIFIIIATLFSSCATIFHGAKEKINITSDPSGAKIFVNGVNTGDVTPAEIKVKRRVKDGPSSTAKNQNYTLKKEGYSNFSHTANSKFGTVPFLGNILTYGLGWVVDGISGSNRKYPKTHHFILSKGSSNDLLIDRASEKEPEAVAKTVIEKTVNSTVDYSKTTLDELKNEKDKAVAIEDYNTAKTIKQITEKNPDNNSETVTIIQKKEANTTTVQSKENVVTTTPVKKTKSEKPSSSLVSEIILDEDFSDNSFGWKEKLEKKSNYQIKDGIYYMKDNTLSLKSPKHLIPNFHSRTDNYILEASFSFLDTKKNQFVGLGLGFSSDSSIYYVFNLMVQEGVKKVVITPFLGVGLRTMNQNPIFKGDVKSLKDVENIIKIIKQDHVTKFYVNDELLAESPGFVFNSSIIKFNTGIWNKTGVNWIKITKTGTSKMIINKSNKRDIVYKEIKDNEITSTTIISTKENLASKTTRKKIKIKKSEENIGAKDLKYRRSSLYTMMVYDPLIEHHETIKNAFGNLDIPSKFNDHNVGPYSILSIANIKKQENQISSFLRRNDIAKKMVSKWFNRDAEGKFNMDVIAKRGLYDASAVDKAIASNMARGNAMLADAGEELINKTFIVINDFKFIDKAKKGKFLTNILNDVAKEQAKDGEIGASLVTGALSFGVKAGAKGYIIRSTSYLYKLEWNEETQAIFYQDYWTDATSFDPEKVNAFNNANNFKLKFIGSQAALADVQSSIFSEKSDEDLIKMATIKAIEKAIGKLERKFEEFRTKTPLVSTEPLAAKIGTKEGLEKGDKFEVLEKEIDPETGKATYKRVGVIKVDSKNIWNNSYSPEEMKQLEKEGKLSKLQYTIFKGSGKYYPGQLIKQIN